MGAADIALTAQHSRLSDGNRRVTLQAYARYPLAPAVFVVYNASRITFDERSLRYWDPLDYVAHVAGLEVGTTAARARVGRARSSRNRLEQGVATADDSRRPGPQPRPTRVVDRSAFQMSSSGELSWRGPGWEGTSAISYGLGRVGEYRRLAVTLGARIIP